jgi:hypothetical protein
MCCHKKNLLSTEQSVPMLGTVVTLIPFIFRALGPLDSLRGLIGWSVRPIVASLHKRPTRLLTDGGGQ